MTERSAINSSAANVFDVLRLIAKAEEPLGVSEISRRLALPASTVYRALMTLEESDYIVRFQNLPKYELGPMPQLLNRAIVHRYRLHASSRPFLRELAESTGQTVSITVRLGWYGLRLAGVFGSRDIYHRDRLGEVSLLHDSLPGRGILAFLTVQEFDAYRTFVNQRHPDATSADWARLARLLHAARGAGFEHEQLVPEEPLCAIALPVRDNEQQVIAAIAISGPIYNPAEDGQAIPWLAVRNVLEADMKMDPGAFGSPFAQIHPNEIFIRLGRGSGDTELPAR